MCWPGNSEHLQDLLSTPSGALFKRLVDQYALGSGISGVQPKALVPIANESNIGGLAEHTAVPLKTIIVNIKGDATLYPYCGVDNKGSVPFVE